MIYKHKHYPHTVDIDKIKDNIACGFKLDADGNKIRDKRKANGDKYYKRIITLKSNLQSVNVGLTGKHKLKTKG